MSKGRPWAKMDVGMPRDPKIATLSSDAARWAFVAIVLAAKEQDRPGGFESTEHLAAVVSPSVASHVEALVDKGLLSLDPEGGIHVSKWSRYQIDPTKPERAARYRERVKAAAPVAVRAPRGGAPSRAIDVIRGIG
jgi:hypothetical protein